MNYTDLVYISQLLNSINEQISIIRINFMLHGDECSTDSLIHLTSNLEVDMKTLLTLMKSLKND